VIWRPSGVAGDWRYGANPRRKSGLFCERQASDCGLAAGAAAVYLSLSPTVFRELVREGVMPRPRLVRRRKIWDVGELDQAFGNLPRDGGDADEAEANSWADYE